MNVLAETLKSTHKTWNKYYSKILHGKTLESCARVPTVIPQHVCECVGLSLICSLASEVLSKKLECLAAAAGTAAILAKARAVVAILAKARAVVAILAKARAVVAILQNTGCGRFW